MTRKISHSLLIGCVAALAGACTPAAITNPPAASSPAASSPAASGTQGAPAPLTIGIIVPFTESAINSEIGVAQQRSAKLFVQQQGGKLAGRDVRFVYSDESVTGALDLVKAQQLVEQEHADVLLGLVGSDGAYAVRTYVDGKHVAYIDTNASGNVLTRTVAGCTPSCKSAYVFRSSYSSWQLSEPLGEWAAKAGATQFYLAFANDTFGTESAGAFVEGLAKQGGAATVQSAVAPGTEWAKVIAAIVAQPTKDVFAAFEGMAAEGFIAAWDQAHLSDKGYKLYGPGPLTETAILAKVKSAAVGVTTASFWSSTLANSENLGLISLFASTYKDEAGNPVPADSYVVAMWDGMTALDRALQKTGGDASGDALVAALETVSFKSPRGAFAFDQGTHNVIQDIYIRQVRAIGTSVANAVIDTVTKVRDPGK